MAGAPTIPPSFAGEVSEREERIRQQMRTRALTSARQEQHNAERLRRSSGRSDFLLAALLASAAVSAVYFRGSEGSSRRRRSRLSGSGRKRR